MPGQTSRAAPARPDFDPAVLDLVRHFESPHDGDRRTPELEPKMCPSGYWTIGYGERLCAPADGHPYRYAADRAAAMAEYHRLFPGGLTLAEAGRRLVTLLGTRAATVARLVKVPLTGAQLAALASFEFNTGALAGSTLLKKLNARDYDGAAGEFDRWTKADRDGRKVTLPGLVTRRNAEEAMFRGGDWRSALDDRSSVPVAPAPALKPVHKSITVQTGIAGLGGAAATLSAAQPLIDQAVQASDGARRLFDLLPRDPAVLAVAGGVLAVAIGVMLVRLWLDRRHAGA